MHEQHGQLSSRGALSGLPTPPSPPSPELKGLQRGAVHREKKVALALQTLETHEAKLIVSPEISYWRTGCKSEIPSLLWEASGMGGLLPWPTPNVHFIVSLPYKSNTALCKNRGNLKIVKVP